MEIDTIYNIIGVWAPPVAVFALYELIRRVRNNLRTNKFQKASRNMKRNFKR